MNQGMALTIFVATLPLLCGMLLYLWKLDRIESRIDHLTNRVDHLSSRMEERFDTVEAELKQHGERLATLEERDRLRHPVVQP